MDRIYFKRLNYHKEEPKKAKFKNLHFEILDNCQCSLFPIQELQTRGITKNFDWDSAFDFTVAKRQKNCGLGDNFVAEAKEYANSGFFLNIPANITAQRVTIHYHLDEKNPALYDMNYIEVGENSKLKLVIYYDSDKGDFYRNGLLSIKLHKNATLDLIKIQNISLLSRNFETLKMVTSERSKFNFYPVELGAVKSATSSSTYMGEEWAEVTVHPLYLVDEERRVDFEQNLIINGRNSLGTIDARGALKDKGIKIFRGNVFLNKGCKRSIGRFANSDIILNKGVRAQSIPTILCDEDDVMGEHAASFEAINKQKMYYLMSRGFDSVSAKKLIVESAFNPVFRMIEDDDIREHLEKLLSKKLA